MSDLYRQMVEELTAQAREAIDAAYDPLIEAEKLRVEKMSGGYIVPAAFYEDRLVWNANSMYRALFGEPTWEERLQAAIRQRSIQYRLSVARAKWRYRLVTAYEVIRGSHECDDYRDD